MRLIGQFNLEIIRIIHVPVLPRRIERVVRVGERHIGEERVIAIRLRADPFRGLRPNLVTLPINFRLPCLRELFLSLGAVNSSVRTFRSVLSRGAGTVLVVVVGGAEESMHVVEETLSSVPKARIAMGHCERTLDRSP